MWDGGTACGLCLSPAKAHATTDDDKDVSSITRTCIQLDIWLKVACIFEYPGEGKKKREREIFHVSPGSKSRPHSTPLDPTRPHTTPLDPTRPHTTPLDPTRPHIRSENPSTYMLGVYVRRACENANASHEAW
jgi:hypothetical protein